MGGRVAVELEQPADGCGGSNNDSHSDLMQRKAPITDGKEPLTNLLL